ncbi:hypothetical protein [Aliivibrio fischeri]|uniref:Uncharacterized protein n=1 Tax=Aliivibrio fischeri TaxID=668 RepID=A0A510UNJ6_ALIFS|nr:hypothetical protein [Aliivibrio fischeri]GEK16227.1 hypothetical protein AFI02nite_42630 [Aliivibrio fischeri]
MMEKIVLMSFLLFSSFLYSETLETENYRVTVDINCVEGEMLCKNVTYIGESKKSGNKLKLIGETVHTMCADGVTPCSFSGYRFINKDVEYFVTVFGDLIVSQTNGEILLKEFGEWVN